MPGAEVKSMLLYRLLDTCTFWGIEYKNILNLLHHLEWEKAIGKSQLVWTMLLASKQHTHVYFWTNLTSTIW